MIQTVEEERAYWDAADPAVEVWGVGTWDEGVTACLEQIEPIFADKTAPCILDLGCGPGRLAGPIGIRHPAATVWGIDISKAMVERCRQATPRNVSALAADGRTIPMGAGFFDVAYSVALFQHLPHDAVRGYLVELARVLKSGGRVRFQHVLGREDSFMAHQVCNVQLAEWCEDAGLKVIDLDVGCVHFQWVWLTGERL